ncbi:hypothetical protein MJO10_30415, partial [Salmonella enterica subsp. enterica serovar Anatum]|nr:hypothetical protein [Salmonella enterica subsp. enterica serovar Anatum]
FGFDDAPGATWLEPGLSTVYLPIEDMIATAIDQAVRLANSEPDEKATPEAILQAFNEYQLLCALREGPFGVRGLNDRIEQAMVQ